MTRTDIVRKALIAVTIVLVVAARPSRTGAADTDELKEAKAHGDKGMRLYNLGKYQEAIDEFTKSYEGNPLPLLLFNIGQSYRHLDNAERAIFFFKRFLLVTKAGADGRDEAEEWIKALEPKLPKEKRPGGTAEAVAVPQSPSRASAESNPTASKTAEAPTPAGSAGTAPPSYLLIPPPGRQAATSVPSKGPEGTFASPAVPVQATEHKRVTTTWWFWTAVGAGVAALVVGSLLLTADRDQVPSCPATSARCFGMSN